MTTLTALRPGVWLRLPDARPDSPFARWRQLVSVDVVGAAGQALTMRFAQGPPSPFHAGNLHLLDLSETKPEETV